MWGVDEVQTWDGITCQRWTLKFWGKERARIPEVTIVSDTWSMESATQRRDSKSPTRFVCCIQKQTIIFIINSWWLCLVGIRAWLAEDTRKGWFALLYYWGFCGTARKGLLPLSFRLRERPKGHAVCPVFFNLLYLMLLWTWKYPAGWAGHSKPSGKENVPNKYWREAFVRVGLKRKCVAAHQFMLLLLSLSWSRDSKGTHLWKVRLDPISC